MAAATSFASPQMYWNAPDPITSFARFKQKCQLIFSSVLKDTDDEEKVSYILLWSGEKGLYMYNIYIEDHLTWKHHISYVCKQIAKSIGIILRSRFFLSSTTKLTLYYTLIYPLSSIVTVPGRPHTYLT